MKKATEDMVKDYSEQTSLSQSRVVELLMVLGVQEFEKRYLPKKAEKKEKDSEHDKSDGEKLADAYGRKILHNYSEDNPDWTPIG